MTGAKADNSQNSVEIAAAATVDVISSEKSANPIADKQLQMRVVANLEAAKGAVGQLQESMKETTEPAVKETYSKAVATLQEDIKEASQLSAQERNKQTVANIADLAEGFAAIESASLAEREKLHTTSVSAADVSETMRMKGFLQDLVNENPAAAKAAERQLEGKKGMEDAVESIKTALQSAGVGGGKDVQPHDVRHDAATIARPNQLGG